MTSSSIVQHPFHHFLSNTYKPSIRLLLSGQVPMYFRSVVRTHESILQLENTQNKILLFTDKICSETTEVKYLGEILTLDVNENCPLVDGVYGITIIF